MPSRSVPRYKVVVVRSTVAPHSLRVPDPTTQHTASTSLVTPPPYILGDLARVEAGWASL